MQVIFYDEAMQFCDITLFRRIGDVVILKGNDLPNDKICGFKVMEGETVIADCPEFQTKYNTMSEFENTLMFSNDPGLVETEDEPAERFIRIPENITEDIDPLTNEELTECVADLMYEMSMSQLGL